MPVDASNPPLQEIGGYEILEKVAEGGMGTVYKGRRRSDGLVVAIKILPAIAAKNPVLLQRFKREFNAARQLDHPNIVRAIEYCDTVPTPFLVMEFVEGESLGQRIEREGKLTEAEAIRIMAQVCQGLHRAHKQNLIHRDVKPDNIMLTKDGTAKLTDLGLVKDVEGEMNLTRTGRGLGTPHFMAPEQFRNAKNADVRCDVYSLGATLYMMVTGKMPFDGCGPLDAWMKKSNNDFLPPRSIDASISERIDGSILRAMSANPEMRPASCRDFFEDLTAQGNRRSTGAMSSQDLWYMVYKDEEGAMHTVKGTTDNIKKAFRDGLLGDASNIRAARTKQGPFQPLSSCNEFRDLFVTDAESSRSTPHGTGGPKTVVPVRTTPDQESTVAMPVDTSTPTRYRPGSMPPPVSGKFAAVPMTAPTKKKESSKGLIILFALLALGIALTLGLLALQFFK